MGSEKVVVIKKKTQLEELLVRHSTKSQAKFYVERAKQSYSFYDDAHETYQKGLKDTLSSIPSEMRMQIIDKKDLANFQFGDNDIIVVVGDPGLFINVAKYVGSQPIISVNPDEERFDGVLSTCNVRGFARILKKTMEQRVDMEPLTMVESRLNNGEVMAALNDLFIGRKTQVSARYSIEHEGVKEKHSTSGIVVSTGTGSTGWLTSFKTWIESTTGGEFEYPFGVPFGRGDDYLVFNVREPFPSKITGTKIVCGVVTRDNPLIIESNMPEEGVIFGDGIENDFLQFTSGRTATIQPSEEKVYLVKGGGR